MEEERRETSGVRFKLYIEIIISMGRKCWRKYSYFIAAQKCVEGKTRIGKRFQR